MGSIPNRPVYPPMITTVKVQPSHVLALAENIRKADREELRKMTDADTLEVLVNSVAASTKSHTVLLDGEVVAIYGVSPHPADATVGLVWLIGTHLLDTLWVSLGKLSESTLAYLSEGFEVITNITDEDNGYIIKWLEWCGFGFSNTRVLIGDRKHKFIQFYRRVVNV